MTDGADKAQAGAEWHAFWPLPILSALGLAVAFSYVYTAGVFIAPLQQDLGWSRTVISSGLVIVSVISVVLAPFVGGLVDRVGSRRIALPGLFLYCAASAALSLAGKSILVWWLLWSLVGLGSAFIKPTVWAAAITSRFEKGRGLAMSVALCGSGLGGAILPYLSTVLIANYGWREAFVIIGIGEAFVSIPWVFLFFSGGHDRPRLDANIAATRRSDLPGVPLGQALRSGTFVRLAVATLLITIALLSLSVHLVPIFTNHGMPPRTAAAIAGLVGASMIVGRLVTGGLLDRFSGPRTGMIAFLLPILACALLLIQGRGGLSAVAAALLLGLSLGSEVDVVMYLASRYFGLRHFGVLYGTLNGLTSLGTGLGPLLGGYVFDRSGSYDPLFWMLMPLFVVAALLVGSLGAYPEIAALQRDRIEPRAGSTRA